MEKNALGRMVIRAVITGIGQGYIQTIQLCLMTAQIGNGAIKFIQNSS